MSVLNKKPYINSVLESLSSENLSALANLMNGLGDRTELLKTMDYPAGNRTNISAGDKGVHLCSLQVGPTLYHGYLIYTDDYCTLLHFTDFNSLSIFDIDVEKKWLETISEYLDINELRRVAYEISDGSAVIEVSASNIKSTGVSEGQVLKADGSGGAVWGEAGGGEELPIFDLSDNSNAKVQDLINLAGSQNRTYCIIKFFFAGSSNYEKKGYLTIAGNLDLTSVYQVAFVDDYSYFAQLNQLITHTTSENYDEIGIGLFLTANTYEHVRPLLPEASTEDSGKIPAVNASGSYELVSPSGGGGDDNSLEVDLSSLTPSSTVQDLLDLCNIDTTSLPSYTNRSFGYYIGYGLMNIGSINQNTGAQLGGIFYIVIATYGGVSGTLHFIDSVGHRSINFGSVNDTLSSLSVLSEEVFVPSNSSLANDKTYNLQSVNGAAPTWQEASSGGGTQLYKHEIGFTDENNDYWDLQLITTTSQQLTLNSTTRLLSGVTLISGGSQYSDWPIIFYFVIDADEGRLVIEGVDGNLQVSIKIFTDTTLLTNFTDTVTAL